MENNIGNSGQRAVAACTICDKPIVKIYIMGAHMALVHRIGDLSKYIMSNLRFFFGINKGYHMRNPIENIRILLKI
jgi:hypothetical protein